MFNWGHCLCETPLLEKHFLGERKITNGLLKFRTYVQPDEHYYDLWLNYSGSQPVSQIVKKVCFWHLISPNRCRLHVFWWWKFFFFLMNWCYCHLWWCWISSRLILVIARSFLESKAKWFASILMFFCLLLQSWSVSIWF